MASARPRARKAQVENAMRVSVRGGASGIASVKKGSEPVGGKVILRASD